MCNFPDSFTGLRTAGGSGDTGKPWEAEATASVVATELSSLGKEQTQLPHSSRAQRAWSAEVESPLSHQGRKHRLTGQGRLSISSLSTHGSQVTAANCRVSLQPLRASSLSCGTGVGEAWLQYMKIAIGRKLGNQDSGL